MTRLTGNKTTWRRKWEALEQLEKLGIRTDILTVMTSENIRQFDSFIRLLEPHPSICWRPLHAETQDGDRHPVSRDEIRSLAAKLSEARSRKRWKYLSLGMTASRSAFPRRSCRNGIGGRRAWMRCAVLYLRGISTGDFQEALAALLGKEAPNLSAAVISRLTAEWKDEYDRWQKRDLSARRYVYVWADGVYLQARMEDNTECMLVLIGATPEGKKELVGFQVGARENAQSWRELLFEVKRRGLKIAPEIAVGDGALGFWKAIDEVFPGTRHQRCWVHKTANVLNKVALSVQANMKKDLREVYLAPNRASAEVAIDVFAEKYGAKYDKAVECLTKDRETMLSFYDFPAEHWDHLRTTNPIESVFATVRHRTARTRGSLSSTTAKLMVFKLIIAASKTWRRLQGENQLPKVIGDVRFQDGIEVIEGPANHAA